MLNTQEQNVTQSIIDEILALLAAKGSTQSKIDESDELNAHLGLTSLELAQLVAMLEVRLDADPFATQTPITRIRTVGDLIDAYEQFLSGEPAEPESNSSDALLAAQQRAASRRRK